MPAVPLPHPATPLCLGQRYATVELARPCHRIKVGFEALRMLIHLKAELAMSEQEFYPRREAFREIDFLLTQLAETVREELNKAQLLMRELYLEPGWVFDTQRLLQADVPADFINIIRLISLIDRVKFHQTANGVAFLEITYGNIPEFVGFSSKNSEEAREHRVDDKDQDIAELQKEIFALSEVFQRIDTKTETLSTINKENADRAVKIEQLLNERRLG
ncbi:hypothetical protein MKK67_00480 [Methylobacterium sp. J-072]|uniref:hypothetical protein n=1 Tax=Methylobacterium sp. J-072 TaxID=2836651 RepID=UPI001FBB0B1B|nr:hypothetical protein [Methylobacterium sp. J-072]MCJ2090991.1 hypothetical protein [Methylobacterium sp. J-072]